MAQKCYLIETQVKRCRSLELFSAKIPNETGFQIVQQNIGLQKTQTKHWPAKTYKTFCLGASHKWRHASSDSARRVGQFLVKFVWCPRWMLPWYFLLKFALLATCLGAIGLLKNGKNLLLRRHNKIIKKQNLFSVIRFGNKFGNFFGYLLKLGKI